MNFQNKRKRKENDTWGNAPFTSAGISLEVKPKALIPLGTSRACKYFLIAKRKRIFLKKKKEKKKRGKKRKPSERINPASACLAFVTFAPINFAAVKCLSGSE